MSSSGASNGAGSSAAGSGGGGGGGGSTALQHVGAGAGGGGGGGGGVGVGGGDGEEEVVLHLYDLSMGLARTLSVSLVGRQIDIIPHTGVVVHGEEHFYSGGLQALPPAHVAATFGLSPVERLPLGRTRRSRAELRAFIASLEHRYTAEAYDLFAHNCNHYSDEVSRFLLGASGAVPHRIMSVPEQVRSTPSGAQLAAMFSGGLAARAGGGGGGGFDPFAAMARGGGAGAGAGAGSNPLASIAAAAFAASAGGPAGGSAAAGSSAVAAARSSSEAARRVLSALAPRAAILKTHTQPMLAAEAGAVTELAARLARAEAAAALPADSPHRLSSGESAALAALPAALSGSGGGGSGGAALAALPALAKVLRGWPAVGAAFPALALLRLLALREDCGASLTAGTAASDGSARGLLWDILGAVVAPAAAGADARSPWFGSFAASVLAMAVLCNAFATAAGAAWARQPAVLSQLIDALSRLLATPPLPPAADAAAAPAAARPELRRLAAAAAYNLANVMPVGADSPVTDAGGAPLVTDASVQLLGGMLDTLDAETDAETQRRRILAAGRIILREGPAAAELIGALSMADPLVRIAQSSDTHTAVKVLADEVMRLLEPPAA